MSRKSQVNILYSPLTYDDVKSNLINSGEYSSDELTDDLIYKELEFETDYLWHDFKDLYYALIPRDTPLVVHASLGLWNGRKDLWAAPYSVEQLDSIIFGDKYFDIYTATVSVVNRNIVITAPHHDGTNVYTIKRLTPSGVQYLHNYFKRNNYSSLLYYHSPQHYVYSSHNYSRSAIDRDSYNKLIKGEIY